MDVFGRVAMGCLLLGAATAHSAIVPSGCTTDFLAQPVTYRFDYEQDLQPIWSQFCEDCHVNHVGNNCGGPCGGLDLDPGQSYFSLVNAPGNQDSSVLLVKPGQPQASLLLHKLNCSMPGPFTLSSPMPLGRPQLSAALRARLYDWIALGAPEPDTLLKATFETYR